VRGNAARSSRPHAEVARRLRSGGAAAPQWTAAELHERQCMRRGPGGCIRSPQAQRGSPDHQHWQCWPSPSAWARHAVCQVMAPPAAPGSTRSWVVEPASRRTAPCTSSAQHRRTPSCTYWTADLLGRRGWETAARFDRPRVRLADHIRIVL